MLSPNLYALAACSAAPVWSAVSNAVVVGARPFAAVLDAVASPSQDKLAVNAFPDHSSDAAAGLHQRISDRLTELLSQSNVSPGPWLRLRYRDALNSASVDSGAAWPTGAEATIAHDAELLDALRQLAAIESAEGGAQGEELDLVIEFAPRA